MKNLFFLLALCLAATAVQADPDPSTAGKPTRKQARQMRRAARMLALNKEEDVYKGQMAIRMRVINDAVDAQNDPEPQESKPAKMTRQSTKPESGRPIADLHATAAN